MVAKVQVHSHKYIATTEQETLLEETIRGTDQLFVFSQPHHTYSISGGTLVASGANWAKITADGDVTLKAQKYVHTTVIHTKQNPLATSSERSNLVTVSEATLVHTGNVQTVLERLYEIKQMRTTLKQNVIVEGQLVGTRVASDHPWGTSTEGFLTCMESTLTQTGHIANVTILGEEETGNGVDC